MVYSTFNARSEEFASKVSFKDAWRQGQRCLVVTGGFYEWQKLDPKGKNKQPYAWPVGPIHSRSSGELRKTHRAAGRVDDV